LHEIVKNKAEIEDAESISNLVNDLWERFHELEKGGATAGGNEAKPIIPRVTIGGGSSSLGSRGNPALKDIQTTLNDLAEKYIKLNE
jgi:hypothetical protein